MASKENTIRVAITGGGLAGAALARGLLVHPHLKVQIFESAAAFSERGAAVGLGTNGLHALRMIGAPPNGIRPCIDQAGGVTNNGNIFLLGKGPTAGKKFLELGPKPDQDEEHEVVVHRAQMLAELLREVPPDSMSVNKKLQSVTEKPEGLILHFADGSDIETDVLIGADGIHGVVRGIVLGADHPATAPVFSGFWDGRNLFSYDEAVQKIGSQWINKDDSRQHDWFGPDGVFIHDIIDDGKLVALACAGYTDEVWPSAEWKRPLERAELEKIYTGWCNGPQIVEAMMAQEEPTKFSEWVHRDAPTYTRSSIAVMGDAAHAMVPFQASGATQSLEDAMVLSTVLGAVRSKADIPAALKAYDEVRRPRSQAIVASSYKTGMIAFGRDPEVGLDPEKMRVALQNRWDFIMEFDLAAHKEEALRVMQDHLSS